MTIYEVAPFAESIAFEEDYITMGFSLAFFKLVPAEQAKMPKGAKHAFFDEKNKNGDEALLQFSGGDSMFQELFSLVTSREETYSVRALIKKMDENHEWLREMTTRQLSEGF